MPLAARNYAQQTNFGSTGNTIPALNSGGSLFDVYAQEVSSNNSIGQKIIKYLVFFIKNTTSGSTPVNVTSINITGDAAIHFKLDGLDSNPSAGDSATTIKNTLGSNLVPGDSVASSANKGFLDCTAVANGVTFGVDDGAGEPTTRKEYIDGHLAIIANPIEYNTYRTFIVTCEPEKNLAGPINANLEIVTSVGPSLNVTLSIAAAGAPGLFRAFTDLDDTDGSEYMAANEDTGLNLALSDNLGFVNYFSGSTATNETFSFVDDIASTVINLNLSKRYLGQKHDDVFIRFNAQTGGGGQMQFSPSSITLHDESGLATTEGEVFIKNIMLLPESSNHVGVNLLEIADNSHRLSSGENIILGLQHREPNATPGSLTAFTRVRFVKILFNSNPDVSLLHPTTGNSINIGEGAVKIQESIVPAFSENEFSDMPCFFVNGTRGPVLDWSFCEATQPHLNPPVSSEFENYDGGVLRQTNNSASTTISEDVTINVLDDLIALGGINGASQLTGNVSQITKGNGSISSQLVNVGGTFKNTTHDAPTQVKSLEINYQVPPDKLQVLGAAEILEGASTNGTIKNAQLLMAPPKADPSGVNYDRPHEITYVNYSKPPAPRTPDKPLSTGTSISMAATASIIKLPNADCVKPLPAELILWHGGDLLSNHRGMIDDNTAIAGLEVAVTKDNSNTGWIGHNSTFAGTDVTADVGGKAVKADNWRTSLNGMVIEQNSRRFRYTSTDNSLIGLGNASGVTSQYATRTLNEFGHNQSNINTVVTETGGANAQKLIASGCVAWSAIASDGTPSDANEDDNNSHYFNIATVDNVKSSNGNPFRMHVFNNVNASNNFETNPAEASNEIVYSHMKTLWLYNIGSEYARFTRATLGEWGKKSGGAGQGTWTNINPMGTNPNFNEAFEHDATGHVCSPIKVWIPQFSTANATLDANDTHDGDDKAILVDGTYQSLGALTKAHPSLLTPTHEFTKRFRKQATYDAANQGYIMQPYKNNATHTSGDKPWKTIPVQVFADHTKFTDDANASNEDGTMPANKMYRVKLTLYYVTRMSNSTNDLDITGDISANGDGTGGINSNITERKISVWLSMKYDPTAGTMVVSDEDQQAITSGEQIDLGNMTF